MSGPIANGEGKVLTLEDLIEAMNKQERTPSNVPKVNTFHFNGERVSDWLDLVEQALVGLSDAVKFQRIMKYVLHIHHQEVEKVINAANGSWARFKDGMQRKYRLDGMLTTADLEAMNRDDFTTVGGFVQEIKKKARKVHGISEESQCAIFLGLLTVEEAAELTSHGGGSEKLTWATIDKGVAEGSLDEVEQYQMRLQRRKRKERDATASGTPGIEELNETEWKDWVPGTRLKKFVAREEAIERLRGADRFAEPMAQIRREARTRPEVEAGIQELRPSPVGPDGRPIRLKIENAEEFIPAFEKFMHDQGMLRDEWARTLPLWTRKAERPLARQRLEEAGALLDQPPPPKPYGIKEMRDEFLDQHGEGLTTPEKAEVGTSKKADEYLDRKIHFLTKTFFDRYMMLEADLRRKEMKEMSHGVRLEAVEAEVRKLRALVASQVAIIQDLRQQPRGGADRADREGPAKVVDRAESSRQGEQRQAGHGL
ncbi:hypothetical protein CBR_g46256 [Chara braunii]|uniref:Retrotransposon gag domain-containing protein n=1 Tax=Chara braunii TaxID=69332 RepID=A0A388K442_CHABU|nr:hypothetical protein CBR_g46256 [Chara braunii]|eukprot:GBG64713.1 hypothetical protein CBR_g46256 [Chara braunii]